MTSHPSETPGEPMTEEQLRLIIGDDVAVRALMLLGQPYPTFRQWTHLADTLQRRGFVT